MADSGIIDSYRHDEIALNMGMPSKRSFEDTYENSVTEMTRNLVNYVKSLRDSRENIVTGQNAEPAPDVTMNSDGFPVLPVAIEQKSLKKRELEEIMRAYMGRHYCKTISSTNILFH
jgi:hypothetical protein